MKYNYTIIIPRHGPCSKSNKEVIQSNTEVALKGLLDIMNIPTTHELRSWSLNIHE